MAGATGLLTICNGQRLLQGTSQLDVSDDPASLLALASIRYLFFAAVAKRRSPRTRLPRSGAIMASVAFGALFSSSPLAAQMASPPTAGDAPVAAVPGQDGQQTQAGTETSGLVDIVVTAQRRSERLQDVPISVTAVTADIARDIGIDNAADLSLVAPAVSFQTTVNGGGVAIRGVGGNYAIGDEPPNAIYVDGVYQAFSPAFLAGFNNIQQVEVLKGPQGTLFGRNASGGVVQVVTRTPSFDTHVDASVGYGNYDTLDGSLYATSGITSNLAADIALAGSRQGKGYGRNVANGSDAYKGYAGSVRSKLYWEPGSDTKVTLIGLYSKSQPWETQGGQIFPGYVDRAGGTGAGFRNVSRNDNTRFTVEQAQGSLTISHNASWAALTSITSYDYTQQRSTFDQDGSRLDLLAFDGNVVSKTWTQELRAQALPGSRVNWIGGIYIYDNVVDVEPILVRGAAAAAFGGSYSFYSKAPINSYAGFGQVSVPFGRTTLTGGARYTLDDKRLDISVVNAAGALIPLAFSSNPRRASKSFSKFTYRVAVDHKFTPELMIYASVNTGFKAGAYGLVSLSPSGRDAQTTFPDPVDPQTVTAYEVGFKGEFLDRRLRLNASLYQYELDDIQLRVAVPGGSVLVNAAKARTRGVDLDVAWRLTSRLTIQGAFSYLGGKYTDFPNPPYFRPIVNTAGAPTGGLVQFAGPNAAGNRTILSPKVVSSFIVDYRLPTSIGEFGIVGSYEYNDGYFFDPQNLFRSDSRHLVNGTLRWKPRDSRFDVSAYLKNLLGERYIISNNTSSLGPLYWASAPTTYGARLAYRF